MKEILWHIVIIGSLLVMIGIAVFLDTLPPKFADRFSEPKPHKRNWIEEGF